MENDAAVAADIAADIAAVAAAVAGAGADWDKVEFPCSEPAVHVNQVPERWDYSSLQVEELVHEKSPSDCPDRSVAEKGEDADIVDVVVVAVVVDDSNFAAGAQDMEQNEAQDLSELAWAAG